MYVALYCKQIILLHVHVNNIYLNYYIIIILLYRIKKKKKNYVT